MSRLVMVSNRLPVTISTAEAGELVVRPSAGGLATGLRGIHNQLGSCWVGWPGGAVTEDNLSALELEMRSLGAVAISLTPDDLAGYYRGFANGVLWPLFHYQIDRLPNACSDWAAYLRVNERFADAVAQVYEPGDLVWVHDYHLFLVPELLRERLPGARIGFFLHIPFPSSEVFGLLPWRKQILEGMLGADVLGFHTASYLRHFSASLRRTLGIEVNVNTVSWDERGVRLGVFPLGIDEQLFREMANSPSVVAEAAEHRRHLANEKCLLSVDRLDYTKGIPSRLLAIDRLLELHPEWRERLKFIQITAPSREDLETYSRFRCEIDQAVGSINSRWATPSWSPIQHVHRAVSPHELTALYLSSDVMLVTPLRDGMNLVAKEFVAARSAGDGVLVLSEFAGAAAQLPGALLVNPYDVDSTAETIHRALLMPREEQRDRMASLQEDVRTNTAGRWAERFLEALSPGAQGTGPTPTADCLPPALPEPGKHVVLLLDYDGTLVPFAPTPAEAVPDDALLALLARLTAAGAAIHIVSGRSLEFLDAHFGNLLVGLHAEHGLWSRMAGSITWGGRRIAGDEWREPVRHYLEQFTEVTPGSFIEEQAESFSWHFRQATQEYLRDSDFGEWQARELRLLLNEVLSTVPAQVLAGNRVIEVRPNAVNKGLALQMLDLTSETCIVAIGDDTTDEDLFAALPESAITIKVGTGSSRARYRLRSVAEVRSYLEEVAASLTGSQGRAPHRQAKLPTSTSLRVADG